MDLAFLFVSAFAASTIVPMSSEVVLSALAASGSRQPAVLLAVATAGNTLGAVVNWGIGRCAGTWRSRLTSLEHFSVSSHQPAPPPNHPKGTIDGWLGGGAGRTRGSTQGENGLASAP